MNYTIDGPCNIKP